ESPSPRRFPYTTLFRSGRSGVRWGSLAMIGRPLLVRSGPRTQLLEPPLRPMAARNRRRSWLTREIASPSAASLATAPASRDPARSEEHTSELQSRETLV